MSADNAVAGVSQVDIESKKLDIEREKLKVELSKLSIEKSKVKWTAFASIVPLLAIIATVAFGLWTAREQANNAFQLEVSKAIMQAPDPDQALNRAKFYNAIFPGRLPQKFIDASVPSDFVGGGIDPQVKIEFLKIISGKGLGPEQTLRLWNLLFPSDDWAKDDQLVAYMRGLHTAAAESPN